MLARAVATLRRPRPLVLRDGESLSLGGLVSTSALSQDTHSFCGCSIPLAHVSKNNLPLDVCAFETILVTGLNRPAKLKTSAPKRLIVLVWCTVRSSAANSVRSSATISMRASATTVPHAEGSTVLPVRVHVRLAASSLTCGSAATSLGKPRFGNSGGSNREYYRGYYSAKGTGKAALAAYVEQFGPPPSKGGSAWHKPKNPS